MKIRGLGGSVMAAGLACIIFYVLLALRSPFTFDAAALNILFYVGVVALPLGLILLWAGVLKRRRE